MNSKYFTLCVICTEQTAFFSLDGFTLHSSQAHRFTRLDAAVVMARELSDIDGLEINVLDADGVTVVVAPVVVKSNAIPALLSGAAGRMR